MRNYGAMGISSRIAGEAAIGLGVTELADQERTLSRMVEVGQRLVREQGANVLVMGCAGMASYRDALAEASGVPVVEPTQAAAAMALGRARLGW
jgi:Asp/Glu/hydantoin racemase